LEGESPRNIACGACILLGGGVGPDPPLERVDPLGGGLDPPWRGWILLGGGLDPPGEGAAYSVGLPSLEATCGSSRRRAKRVQHPSRFSHDFSLVSMSYTTCVERDAVVSDEELRVRT